MTEIKFGLLKPEDPRTGGMVHKTRDQTLDLMDEIFYAWEPRHQSWIINNSHRLVFMAAAIPGVFFTLKFRRLFGLASKNDLKLFTMGPSVFISGALSSVTHKFLVRDDILLKETECSVCVDMRSAALQTIGGVVVPATLAYGGTIAAALHYKLKLVPRSARGWLTVTSAMLAKASPYIIGVGVAQLTFSAVMVRMQYDASANVMATLETRFKMAQDKSS